MAAIVATSRPGWAEWKPDGTYEGSLDLGDLCHYPAGLGRNPNHDMFIACMTSSGPDGRPEALLMAADGGTSSHVWSTGGAGLAISPTGDAVYLTIPGSPELKKYALPSN